METLVATATPFVMLVAWSVALLVLHVVMQSSLASLELGSQWNASARDDDRKPTGILAGRTARASQNFRETYPAFIGLALSLALIGDPSGWGLTGAWIWLGFRLVYIPLYLAGIPYVRSFAWVASMVGLAIMAGVVIF